MLPLQIEVKKKKNLPPGYQPGEVSNNKYICSSNKMAALWNSRFLKQSTDFKTSSIPLRCHMKPNCQRRSCLSLVAVLMIPFVCHVHLHQYSWFGRIPSAVANRCRKSASLLKRILSLTSTSSPIKLVNIAFQSVPCTHADWAILGDVGAASRRLIFLLKYRGRPLIFQW